MPIAPRLALSAVLILLAWRVAAALAAEWPLPPLELRQVALRHDEHERVARAMGPETAIVDLLRSHLPRGAPLVLFHALAGRPFHVHQRVMTLRAALAALLLPSVVRVHYASVQLPQDLDALLVKGAWLLNLDADAALTVRVRLEPVASIEGAALYRVKGPP